MDKLFNYVLNYHTEVRDGDLYFFFFSWKVALYDKECDKSLPSTSNCNWRKMGLQTEMK